MSSIYINSHYRGKLKLGTYGRLSSYIPAVILPALMTTFFHKFYVVPEVVLNTRQCPVCVQTKAGLLQAGFSTAYPMLLAPMSAFMVFCRRLPQIQVSHDISYLLLFSSPRDISPTGCHRLPNTRGKSPNCTRNCPVRL